MGHAARGEIYIPAEEWAEFVLKFAPRSEGEYDFGPPEQDPDTGDVLVPFAMNTECHPQQEIDPPAWHKKT